MMKIALLLILLAACGTTAEPAPDAATPACSEIEGCADALCTAAGVCTCSRPGQPPITCTARPTDGGVDAQPTVNGRWRLHWACTAGCATPPTRPPLTYSGALLVEAGELAYSDEVCAECNATHRGIEDGGCIVVAGETEPLHVRTGYRLCPAAGGVEASIGWSSRFGPEASTTWLLTGER